MPDEMGTFRVDIELENPARPGSRLVVRSVLVDTGAELSWLPAAALESLGIDRRKEWRFRQADGTVLTRWTGGASVYLGEIWTVDEVVFGEPGDLDHAPGLPARPRRADTMVMVDATRRYTVDEVLAFPADGNRYELVDGTLLVTPAPTAPPQLVIGRLYLALAEYVRRTGGTQVLLSPADISWDRTKLVQPDIFVVPLSEVTASWKTYRTLLLAVEVVSPSSARGDRLVKRRLYQRQGVGTYWVVDPDARLIEIWHPDDDRPTIATETLRWALSPEGPALEVAVTDVFSGLPG
jgi:Uma2 family endonuclease